MDELMILALTQKSSTSRARLIEALRRKRDRAMLKWKALAITIVGFYFWWKGGGVDRRRQRGRSWTSQTLRCRWKSACRRWRWASRTATITVCTSCC